uniref:ribosomal protein S1 n=1 Tax=Hypnea pseudomusciformis TaxID=1545697 RepID=UPI0027D9FF1D|nr:ribosomal protein S1 [Hypnea pseudomusciformis]WCH55219.1 ribosomal protein S1 [Hypnea pseudomusciformis]WCH56812.1 ribosomal protein S1 [Hypnea pseudomusciformis]
MNYLINYQYNNNIINKIIKMQINQNFTENNFAFVLNEYKYNINLGDIVAGTIFNMEKRGFLVDIGLPISCYLPYEEISLYYKIISNVHYSYSINNTTREFFILAYNKQKHQLILSIKRLEYIRGWKRIKQIENEDIILNLKIHNQNRGGLITILEGIQGFIPNSHLKPLETQRLKKKKYIQCKLLMADEKNNKLILSYKKAILSILSKKLKIGTIVSGKIIKIEKYGIFLEIYNTLSLLHISEIANQNIKNINTIFKIGEIIEVKILHLDMQQGRISVSTRNI